MSDQSNNNESENMDNTPNYNDMINPPSWSVEPEQLEGLIDLINNMTNIGNIFVYIVNTVY